MTINIAVERERKVMPPRFSINQYYRGLYSSPPTKKKFNQLVLS